MIVAKSVARAEDQPDAADLTSLMPEEVHCGAERPPAAPKQKPGEVGGPQGPEPTRFGDWEIGGRCSDF